MAKKVGLNVYVDPKIASRLRHTASHYDDRLGDCLAAAILLFLEASPQEQAAAMSRVYTASLTDSVDSLLEEIQAEQARRASGGTRAGQPPKAGGSSLTRKRKDGG